MMGTTVEQEIAKVAELTGVDKDEIRLADDGFCSRGYVIDNGRIVFKFRKTPETTYKDEIRMLNFINSLGLEINLQKVGWISPDDTYLGMYGVIGKSLEQARYDAAKVGEQLGKFLRKLHVAELENAEVLGLKAEIKAWQERVYDSFAWAELQEYFSRDEMDALDDYMQKEMPEKLLSLGEKLVLSHGDLGDGNTFVDEAGKVGVIDFNEACCLDEAADFMDIDDEKICEQMLASYGADEVLQEKVKIRRQLRPLIVFGNYAKRGDTEKIKNLLGKIRRNLL